MKKFTLALSMVLVVLLLALCASAETVVYPVDAETGYFNVTYSDATVGAYYAIVAVEGIVEEGTAPSITEDSIQFIDQKTAESATVAFENILLKVDGTPSTIYLGGSDLSAAILLGYVNKEEEEEETFTVSGTVTSASSKPATVTFTPAEGEAISVDTVAGAYSIEVVAGTYKFEVTKAAHLSYTVNALVIEADTTKDAELIGGNLDGNDEINVGDLNLLLSAFGSESETVDIDGNNEVNVGDLNILLSNFGKSAVVE